MLLYIKDIKTFQVLEGPTVEQDQDSHHFALLHREFTLPLPCFCFLQRVVPDQGVKFLKKLVNYEINFCNFMAGNHSGIISNVLLFSDLKILIFPLYFYFLYTFLTSNSR
jgi:hypothetical protein